MNDFFKKFIICVCIVGLLFGTLRPRIAKANPIAIGAVEFVEGSLGGVVSGGAGYAGYDIIERYKKEASDFIIKKSLSTLTNTFFKFYSDSSGQKYVGIDGSGLDELQSMLEDMRHSSYEGIPVFTNKTTSNTTVSSNEPFMLNGFYMKRYSGTSSAVDYDKFSVNYGDSLSIQFYSTNSYSSSVITKTFLATDDMICRFTASSKGTTFFYYSYDKGTTWYSFNEGVFSRVGDSVFIGYKTVSNSVYVPSSQVITGNGIDGKSSDSVGDGIVAVPISGQYDSTTGQKVWAPIDGANVGVKTGLTAIDSSKVDSDSGTDTGSGTDAGFWSTLWGWLEKIYKGIISIPGAIEALPGEIATSFENALQYVFVPTATDFSDFYNDIEGDVQSKFPYSVSILNSLEVNADEFTDIHVTIWGHDCVIVSAQFVNNNISWIRVVTSCFWLFSLFVYVWRKINSVLSGGDVNSTTVYAPGGGSSPPSVI